MRHTIFLVEDDLFLGEVLMHYLKLNPNYNVYFFNTAKDCIANLFLKPEIICTDYYLPDLRGDELFAKIQETSPNLPVVIISGQSDVELAINLLKKGVNDYIVKNENIKEFLWSSIIKLLKERHSQCEIVEEYNFKKMFVGQSDCLKNVFAKINKAIKTDINISITGQTGTGKEIVAQAIHYNSQRKSKPFVAVNMAAIPKDIMESEFFGNEKGAFTGATNQKKGKFEQADEGTIFLDEIAELDFDLQSKLLRVLQEKEITRVGGVQKIKLNIRIITATHKDLAIEVKKGKFREDLYYRLIGLPIYLPPLRERSEDILILAKHFINLFVKKNKIGPLQLTSSAKQKLVSYYFPGNVRELKSTIELACVMAEKGEIRDEDIIFHGIEIQPGVTVNEQKTLKEYTTDIILNFLRENNNDVIKTAKILDIGKSTIYNLIKSSNLSNQ